MADAAPAIRNGFSCVFPGAITVMCWAHAARCIYKRVEKDIPDQRSRIDIISDIKMLQLSPTKAIFEKLLKLFFVKWKEMSIFCNYFRDNWVEINGNWYEGVAKGVPSTNNGGESFNNLIKAQATIRRKLPIGTFLNAITKCIGMWSKDAVYRTEIDPSGALWREALLWARENVELVPDRKDKNLFYAIDSPIGTDALIWTRVSKLRTFDSYRDAFRVVQIMRHPENYRASTCTCSTFLKEYLCRHVLGVAIRMKILDVPTKIKETCTAIGAKPKRGRPKKVSKALVRE